jgi:molybdopterin converting factor small subunit
MVLVKALGVAAKECGWSSNKFVASDIDSLFRLLPKTIIDMKRRGELVVFVNGAELGSFDDIVELSDNDTVTILPVVHGG